MRISGSSAAAPVSWRSSRSSRGPVRLPRAAFSPTSSHRRHMPSITAFNVAHLHLLLNHIPTVGSVVGLGLLLLALVRRSEHLTHAGLEVLFAIALLTLPAYMSGVGAHEKL